MIIASQKRKQNIAEYLLYMWQVEDIIRANDLDIDKITHNVIDHFELTPDQRRDMIDWYESLIDMMRREGVAKSGHLQMNKNIINNLAQLHNAILRDPRFADYAKRFYAALPHIVELRAKAGNDPKGEIETCFNALYGTLMLRLKNTPISPETVEALKRISDFIALLSHDFALDEKGELFKDDEEDTSNK